MVNFSFSGTFYAIQKSYETSTDAVKRADAAKDTLKKSEGLRENALSGLKDVQPGNTKDLEKLKKDLATRPNLTPTANKVREIACDWLNRSVGFPADGVSNVVFVRCVAAIVWSPALQNAAPAICALLTECPHVEQRNPAAGHCPTPTRLSRMLMR